MFFRFADNTNRDSVASRLRAKRFNIFKELIAEVDKDLVSIIDLGGTLEYWERHAPLVEDSGKKISVFVVNNISSEVTDQPIEFGSIAVRLGVGDATSLEEIESESFDLAFSNSVIEHVGNLFQQIAMADEIKRVSRGYCVQTPNVWFPIEPHFLIPFWQFLPLALRAWVLTKKSVGWVGRSPDYLRAKAECEQVRLMSRLELQQMFPDATVFYERVAGIPKSILAVKRYQESAKKFAAPLRQNTYLPGREFACK